MKTTVKTLRSGFIRSAQQHPDRPAIELGSTKLTYQELYSQASTIAAVMDQYAVADEPQLTAVFAHRTLTAFVGVLAALFRGHGYVPLNRKFPPNRSQTMLDNSGCRTVVVDSESEILLPDILPKNGPPLLLIFPDCEDITELVIKYSAHKVIGSLELKGQAEQDTWQPAQVDENSIAYLLFTSGSTGNPKGVMVSHRNAVSFVDLAVKRYEITEKDRLSQTFDMTFDLSVFDMFVTWERGACLCVPSVKEVINPGRFIKKKQVTVWFSVPSTGVFMKKLGALKPDSYPLLRWSLFCGEPLPAEVAEAWQAAAPRSVVENLYGPTEATIACTVYRWDPINSPSECHNGVVPIGTPFPGMKARVADYNWLEVPNGTAGELLMCGPQVTLGYWQDTQKTAEAFVTPQDSEQVHYRTGDRVYQKAPNLPLVYLGRMDHQIQIHGHRVELGEIEAILREESGESAVIALGWPLSVSGAGGIVAFVGDNNIDTVELVKKVQKRLPDYMVPRKIFLKNPLPLNANGKFDRKALLQELKEMK